MYLGVCAWGKREKGAHVCRMLVHKESQKLKYNLDCENGEGRKGCVTKITIGQFNVLVQWNEDNILVICAHAC